MPLVPASPDTAATRWVIHVRVSDPFVALERRHDPSLEGRPVVVGGRPGGGGRVVAASEEARAAGVHCGQSLADAAATCPDGVFVRGDLARALETMAALHVAVRAVTDQVEWTGLAEAYVGVSGDGRGHEAHRVAEAVIRAMSSASALRVAAGVATARVVAHVAAKLAEPEGMLHVLPGYEARLLAPLDVRWLEGVDPGTAARLRLAGFCTLGALARADASDLLSLLGPCGPVLGRLARGADGRGVLTATRPTIQTVGVATVGRRAGWPPRAGLPSAPAGRRAS